MPVEPLTEREQSILRETIATLYLYGRGDKENHHALCAILRMLMGPEMPDVSDHGQMRDLHHLLSPETDG